MNASEGPAPAGSDVRQSVALAETFVALADTLVDDFDVVDIMDRLVTSCVQLLDMTAAGLLLVDQRGGLQLVASSSEELRLLELFQLQNEQGPCLDCVRTGQPVWEPDLAATPSAWPAFAAEALQSGFRSVYAVPMRLRHEVIGTLNLFRADGPALGPDAQRVAQALADVATIAVLQQRSTHRAALLAEQLQTALDSRIAIEQAKGVLAERGKISMDSAYRALRRYARDGNRLLSAVAEGVVRGDVPADDVLLAGRRDQ